MEGEWDKLLAVSKALQSGDFAFAHAEALRLLPHLKDPEARAHAHACLGTVFQTREAWAESARHFTAALQADPKLNWVYSARALTLARMGETAKAVRSANRGVELEPDDAGNLHVRSVCLLLAARDADPARKPFLLRRAIVDIDEAVVLKPGDATYQSFQRSLHGIVGESPADAAVDGWEIAGKIAKVAGNFVSGMLG